MAAEQNLHEQSASSRGLRGDPAHQQLSEVHQECSFYSPAHSFDDFLYKVLPAIRTLN